MDNAAWTFLGLFLAVYAVKELWQLTAGAGALKQARKKMTISVTVDPKVIALAEKLLALWGSNEGGMTAAEVEEIKQQLAAQAAKLDKLAQP